MPQLSKRALILLSCGALGVLLLIVLVTYAYLSPSGWKARQNTALSHVESKAIVSYTSLDGSEIDFMAYKSDVLIVNIWASWSPYTKADTALLRDIKKEFGDAVTIRAVNRMEPKETAEAYLSTIGKEEGIEYIIDTTDHLYDSLGGYAMPETIVFDNIGNILLHVRGALSNDFRAQIGGFLTAKQ
jgi:thiol-disulfide isomerase/thioredoxin